MYSNPFLVVPKKHRAALPAQHTTIRCAAVCACTLLAVQRGLRAEEGVEGNAAGAAAMHRAVADAPPKKRMSTAEETQL